MFLDLRILACLKPPGPLPFEDDRPESGETSLELRMGLDAESLWIIAISTILFICLRLNTLLFSGS